MIQIKNWVQDESEKILKLLKEKLSFEIEMIRPQPADEWNQQTEIQNKNQKFDLENSPELLVHYPGQSEKVQLLDILDCTIQKNDQSWPELLLVPAIKKAVRRSTKTLNINQAAYVSADGLHIRALVAAAAELGFSRICMVSPHIHWLEEEKKFLSRRLIGLQIETVVTSDLTLRPQDASLFLNAFDLNKSKDYLHDLAYYNFMGLGGVVVDLLSGGAHQVLQDEAGKARLLCVHPIEVLLWWWLEFAKIVGIRHQPSRETEKELIQALLDGEKTST